MTTETNTLKTLGSTVGLGAWPNLYRPAVTVGRGEFVYTLSVMNGEVVIDHQTVKEAAIKEIMAQPFFGPNVESERGEPR